MLPIKGMPPQPMAQTPWDRREGTQWRRAQGGPGPFSEQQLWSNLL
jgi:hypothetical protein